MMIRRRIEPQRHASAIDTLPMAAASDTPLMPFPAAANRQIQA
jgi:hypothetical protein